MPNRRLSLAGMVLPYRRAGSKSMGSSVRGLTSLPESNGPVGSLNRLLSVLSARSANPLTRKVLDFAESSNDSESIFTQEQGGPFGGRGRGERERGCGRRDEKVRLKDCSIGRSCE